MWFSKPTRPNTHISTKLLDAAIGHLQRVLLEARVRVASEPLPKPLRPGKDPQLFLTKLSLAKVSPRIDGWGVGGGVRMLQNAKSLDFSDEIPAIHRTLKRMLWVRHLTFACKITIRSSEHSIA